MFQLRVEDRGQESWLLPTALLSPVVVHGLALVSGPITLAVIHAAALSSEQATGMVLAAWTLALLAASVGHLAWRAREDTGDRRLRRGIRFGVGAPDPGGYRDQTSDGFAVDGVAVDRREAKLVVAREERHTAPDEFDTRERYSRFHLYLVTPASHVQLGTYGYQRHARKEADEVAELLEIHVLDVVPYHAPLRLPRSGQRVIAVLTALLASTGAFLVADRPFQALALVLVVHLGICLLVLRQMRSDARERSARLSDALHRVGAPTQDP